MVDIINMETRAGKLIDDCKIALANMALKAVSNGTFVLQITAAGTEEDIKRAKKACKGNNKIAFTDQKLISDGVYSVTITFKE